MKSPESTLLFLFILFSLLLWSCSNDPPYPIDFTYNSDWQNQEDRLWGGPGLWLNPLQAWQIKENKLSMVSPGGNRNCVLLIAELDSNFQSLKSNLKIEAISETLDTTVEDWVGFQIGLQGSMGDYRDDAVFGKGLSTGWSNAHGLFIGTIDSVQNGPPLPPVFELVLEVTRDMDHVQIQLSALTNNGEPIDIIQKEVHSSWIKGLISICASSTQPLQPKIGEERPKFDDLPAIDQRLGGHYQFQFVEWNILGSGIKASPEREWGPILWSQYTVSDQQIKLTTQFMPVSDIASEVELILDGTKVASASIHPEAFNALFHVENPDDNKNHHYEVRYLNYQYSGLIAADPGKADTVTVASLSCVDDIGFPHHELVANLKDQNPDLYVFHGDQIYERVGGYGVERSSKLDYLRKWIIWGWSFGELTKDKPAVIIPDDHDVYHGNLWGEGGKRADIRLGWGDAAQDSGGYKEDSLFVNMVHRSQTAHLPNPYDATPVLNNISVYYTEMHYGGISFAILADRQWKSAPGPLLPEAQITNGWPQNKNWDASTQSDHPDAVLLGQRQLDFLKYWSAHWDNGISFKAVISQSPFCNVATLPKDIYHDKYVPGLPRYKKDEYPPDDRPVADFDANGWPQHERDKALRLIRKCFAIHLTGDQHLGSTGQYGIEEFSDASYWISSPAVSNLWPRRWFPAQMAGSGRKADDPRYCGDYYDGFGNKITVKAIANPYDIDKQPEKVYDKAPGYSIIKFVKSQRKIELACWPRWASPNLKAPDNQPFEGWPIWINQSDNYPLPATSLDSLNIPDSCYIQLWDADKNELVYSYNPPAGDPRIFLPDDGNSYRLDIRNGVDTIQRVLIRTESN